MNHIAKKGCELANASVRYPSRLSLLFVLLACMMALAQNSPQQASDTPTALQRHALIIGMAYKSTSHPLEEALDDSRAMKDVLEDLEFQVVYSPDPTRFQLETDIDKFIHQTNKGDVALVYYAGHGMQIRGQNYLIPSDYDAVGEADAQHQGYPVSVLLRRLREKGVKLTILILDACRVASFLSSGSTVSGLAQINAAEFPGTYIAMSTLPDETTPAKSLFTEQLVEVLKRPGLSLDEVFNDVRQTVSERTKRSQVPTSWSTSDVGQFVFRDAMQAAHALAEMEANATKIEGRIREIDQAIIQTKERKQNEARQLESEKKELEARLEQLKNGRTKKEAEKEQALEVKRQRQEEMIAQQDKNLAAQRASVRFQFEGLNAKLTENLRTFEGALTLDQARAIVAAAQASIAELQAGSLAAQNAELARIDELYSDRRLFFEQSEEKGAFETTAKSLQRRQAERDKLSEVKREWEAERAKVIAYYSADLATKEEPWQEKINTLTSRHYPADMVSATWQNYDADQGALIVAAGFSLYRFEVSPEKAKELYDIRDKFHIESEYCYADEGTPPIRENIFLVDALGDRFPKSELPDIPVAKGGWHGTADHAYWAGNRFEEFEVIASQELEAGAVVTFILQHHHSWSNVHPVKISVSRDGISFEVDPNGLRKPDPSVLGTWDKPPTHCDVNQLSGDIRNVVSTEITHNKQGEIFLRIKIHDPKHPDDIRTENFADEQSTKVEWVANTHLGIGLSREKVQSRPQAERALTAIQHTIERAVTQARAMMPKNLSRSPTNSTSHISQITPNTPPLDDKVEFTHWRFPSAAINPPCQDYDSCYKIGTDAYQKLNWPIAMAAFKTAATLELSINQKERSIYGDTWTWLGRVYLRMNRIDDFTTAWDEALSVGNILVIPACLKYKSRHCVRGMLEIGKILSGYNIAFVVGLSPLRDVFRVSPLDVAIAGAANVGGAGSLSFQVGDTAFMLYVIPWLGPCKIKQTVKCEPEGTAEQLAIADYLTRTIPKLKMEF